jgi:hypothetical protein
MGMAPALLRGAWPSRALKVGAGEAAKKKWVIGSQGQIVLSPGVVLPCV